MRAHSLDRASAGAVAATCLVAAVCYAGAITQNALVAGVLTGVLGCAAVVSVQLHRHGVGLAVITGLAVAFGWAVVVNALTGDTNGPAARSTLIAGACTSLAVAAASSRRPSLFLVPVGGIVFGALALGAGGEVRIVALVVVVAAVATLAVLEHGRRRWQKGGARVATVVLVSLLVGVAGLVGALVQAHRDARPARVLDPGAVNAQIHPQWADPLPNPAPTHHRDTRVQTGTTRVNAAHANTTHVNANQKIHRTSHLWRWLAIIGLALLALLLLVLATVAARLLVVRLRWRRLRRALKAGSPGDAVAGAWVWARMRLQSCQLPLPPSAAPDLDGAPAALADLPEQVAAPLRKLAPHAAVCAFSAAPLAEREDAQRAWGLSDDTVSAGFAALTRWGRWRARFRSPLERSRSRKPASVTREASRG